MPAQILNGIKNLYYGRIDVSEVTDVNKTSKSKNCNIWHCLHFLNKGFKFQQNVSNGCHDLLMISMDISDIAILNIKTADYCVLIV